MVDVLIEGLKVAGLLIVLLLSSALVYAVGLGVFQAVSGHARRQREAVSRSWLEGWNAAMRGAEIDQAEWIRRLDEEIER